MEDKEDYEIGWEWYSRLERPWFWDSFSISAGQNSRLRVLFCKLKPWATLQVYACGKIHWAAHSGFMYFTVCKLCLNFQRKRSNDTWALFLENGI
jgi:hypothetical protein